MFYQLKYGMFFPNPHAEDGPKAQITDNVATLGRAVMDERCRLGIAFPSRACPSSEG